MKTNPLIATTLLVLCRAAWAHDGAHDFAMNDAGAGESRVPGFFLAQATVPRGAGESRQSAPAQKRPAQADAFSAFAPKVALRWDERFLFIESNGIPAHNMMVGITAWQQQVPLPQNYTGANAWQIPLSPVPSKTPASIRDRFLRGAIAIAANGIPIFNPQNNRGEISADIGELDEWGGHCGRADDYHYHAAPLHLQTVLGPKLPIAYALDGYPIYGLTEPDGSAPAGLDAFNGHTTAALGYHYHASKKYPFVNGGFHGEVVEAGGQVDPQPRANPVRPALQALRGAKITGFERMPANGGKLTYEVNGDKRAVIFSVNADGTLPFEFQNGRDGVVKEVYSPRSDGAGRGGGGERQRPRREERAPEAPAPAAQRTNGFILRSPVVQEGGDLPKEFTGDGEGVTPPLEWSGAPAGTKSFALIMSHVPGPGEMKWYWTLYDIPATTTGLAKAVTGVGKVGTGFKGQVGYEPPHSKGPGRKIYTLTLYALSDSPKLGVPPAQVNRENLLAAMKGITLGATELNVAYARSGESANDAPPQREGNPQPVRDGQQGGRPPRPEVAALDTNNDGTIDADELRNATRSLKMLDANGDGKLSDEELRPPRRDGAGSPPPPPAPEPAPPTEQSRAERRPQGGGKGGADNKGLIKPAIADTMKLNVYADNWFILYVNGRLVAVDPIRFTPHNVVSVDFLPEYPMTIAVMAKDNADPKTGMEYGTNIGDGGFILKFGDGTVTNASWKAKSFFKGPLNHDTSNPKVEHTPIPDKWWAVDFDDSKWANAKEYTEEQVNPKQPYFDADFKGAKFIWTEDIDLDNTIIFRTKIERPDWKQRWNTKPDLDVSEAPLR